jgi:hypothetical protein
VAIVLSSLLGPMLSVPVSSSDETAKNEVAGQTHISDYSSLFGEEYRIPEVCSDATCLDLLDISSIEEGLLHVLYSSASHVRPLSIWLCCGFLSEFSYICYSLCGCVL